jgi:hypothetical protein
MKTYSVGTRVFCDFHFSGKPHGKVVEVTKPGDGKGRVEGAVKVQLTETVGAYRKGEVLTLSAFQAVPVAQLLPLKPGQYHTRLSTEYQFA